MPSGWTRLQWTAALLGLAVGLVAAVYFLAALLGGGDLANIDPVRLADYQVYRAAAQSVLNGSGLYDAAYPTGPGGPSLPFTYPPFAAIIMAPLALLPPTIAAWGWVLLSIAACPAFAVLLLRQAPDAHRAVQPAPLVAAGLITLGLMLSEPVTHGLFVGQVSIFIVLASLVDAAGVVPPRWRGLLVGLAAATKLIPLVFLPYFLLTRQWRAARNSLVAFTAATLLGFAALPQESVRYWTVLMLDTSRVGEVGLSRNKSLLGLLVRWGAVDGGWLWLVLAAGIAAVALWRASRHYARGEQFAAALVVGTLSTVLTPISWPHHQVWIPLVALYLLMLNRRWPAIGGALVLGAYGLYTPLIAWQESGPLWLRLAWEVPTLVASAIALFGLPLKRLEPLGEPEPVPGPAIMVAA